MVITEVKEVSPLSRRVDSDSPRGILLAGVAGRRETS
jgi:hypothetical protein